jgi:hypothetical protein
MEDEQGAVGDDKALDRGPEAVETQVVSNNKVGTEEGPMLQASVRCAAGGGAHGRGNSNH